MNIKKVSFLIVASFCIVSTSFAQQLESALARADSLYKAGQKKKARVLYNKAAKQGSADAHFAIAYKYIVSPKESIYHFSEAAKQGHEKALKNVLDELLFRANSLTLTDPQRALDLYHQAKKANPDLHLFDEQAKARVMKESAVTDDFNGPEFIKKYNIKMQPEGQEPYQIWELAEEASHDNGGRFGKPDPKLVLSLVVRGGFAPAELESAVDSVYENYKKGMVQPFNICDYITSGYGMSFCASRDNEDDSSLRQERLDSLKTGMHASTAALAQKAYDLSAAFIEAKAEREEQHGGSGRGAWITQSEMEQNNQFISRVDSIMNGFKPRLNQHFQQADKQLNQTYKKALKVLARKDQPFQYFTKPKDLRAVQRLWIPYRDASARLFHQLQPSVDEKVWKAWITEHRIHQLNEIPGMKK